MAENQPRGEGGEFGEKVTEQDILRVFDAADEPFLTATEIAGGLPVSRQAVTQRLAQMEEKELVGRKEVGSRAVGWWAKVGPRLRPEVAEQAEGASRDDAIPLDELEAELSAE
jgi:DNA-binding HxlR family transcriptional regulator